MRNKFSLLILSFALAAATSMAQVSTYTFTSSSGTYTPITGTVLFPGGWDDGASNLLTIPFTFVYNNASYTTVGVDANGYITMGAMTGGFGYCGISAFSNTIAAYATDLVGFGNFPIQYTTRGSTPNRQFVVQWENCDHWNNSNQNHWTFQIILNETSNTVQVVWGASTDATNMGPNNCIDNPDESGDVGLIGLVTTDFNMRKITNGVNTWAGSVTAGAATDVCNMSPSNIPANGLTYTWTPIPPTPMVFVSSATLFVNNMAGIGQNSTTQILQVRVVTNGSLVPFNVTNLALSTTGSTNAAADIANAKVYFTGTSNTFSNVTQFGSTVNNPNGAYTVNGTATLSLGTNYFWIVYGITANAVVNDSVRGCCTQITGSGTMGVRVPSITCPVGYQKITELGFWTPIATLAPDQNAGVMILLSDGTVMAKTDAGGGDGIGSIWDKLTPDIHGSYVNGTWSQLTPMADTRLYFSSQVLQDGRVYVAGGEYGSGGSFGEVYNPLTDSWTSTPPQGQRISDANSEILPDGNVLQALVNQAGPVLCDFWNHTNNTYSAAPSCLASHNESTWVKLPDQSILMVNMPDTTSERYIPSLNQWIPDGNVPVRLYDNFGSETGAGLLLPDGRAFFIGATGHTAYYTPTGTTAPGSWIAGPDVPGGNGQSDAPAAMMVNGKILMSAAPVPSVNGTFVPPTVFYEFDFLSNSFTSISAPDGSPSVPIACYQTNMLLLPDGNVLYSNQQDTTIGKQYYIYTPAGEPLAAAKPTVNTVIPITCTTFTITGTLFNGISEGACYGDDWQMATNYPLIRLRYGSNVYYARTSNWNRTAVMTGTLADTADFTLPVGLPGGDFWLELVVNGVASDSFLFHPPTLPTVSFNNIPDSTCSNGSIISLTGSPSGGIFSGGGVTGNSFNPSTAPLGNVTVTYTYTDSIGCSNTSNQIINVSICTGINEPMIANGTLSVYPNPATKRAMISFTATGAENFDLTLLDLLGRTVITEDGKTVRGNNSHSISLDGIAEGIYTICLHAGDEMIKAKLIIQ